MLSTPVIMAPDPLPVLQDVASSRGTDEGHEKEEALKREVVQLRAEVASVLAALQGTDPGANPLLPDLLGRMTDAVEDLRSKVPCRRKFRQNF